MLLDDDNEKRVAGRLQHSGARTVIQASGILAAFAHEDEAIELQQEML